MVKAFYKVRCDYGYGDISIACRTKDPSALDYDSIGKRARLPANFMENFEFYVLKKGKLQDILPNSLGWYILSARALDVIVDAVGNRQDLQLIPLPLDHLGIDRQYCLVNICCVLPCMDLQRSNVRWSENSAGKKYVSAVHELVIDPLQVPDAVDVFCPSLHRRSVVVSEAVMARCREASLKCLFLKA